LDRGHGGGHLEFAKDGTYHAVNPMGARSEGKYRLDGNRLTINNDRGEERFWTVVKLTADALTVNNGSGGMVLEFSRVKEK
jgi:hypothetical protein